MVCDTVSAHGIVCRVNEMMKRLGCVAGYYSTPELVARAALYALIPAALAVLWGQEWWHVLTLWIVSTFVVYRYGHWVRDDEDDDA